MARNGSGQMRKILIIGSIFSLLYLGVGQRIAGAEIAPRDSGHWQYLGEFKATAYCSCKLCCGKSDGITASGHKAKPGTIACNWLPFGSKLQMQEIKPNSKLEAFKEGSIGTVLDRGAKSLFGSKHNHIKHIDLWMASHTEALNYGVRTVNLWVKVA